MLLKSREAGISAASAQNGLIEGHILSRCGHCKHLTPEYKKLGEAVASSPKLKDRVVIAKVTQTNTLGSALAGLTATCRSRLRSPSDYRARAPVHWTSIRRADV